MDLDADTRLEVKRDFSEFLENRKDAAIEDLAKASEEGAALRLPLDMNELFDWSEGKLHRRVLDSPSECIPPFREALEEQLRNKFPKLEALAAGAEVHVAFVGEFGAHRVSPRSLLAACQGKMVCVEGIVTKASVVRPKWVKSVHYCPANGKEQTREYRCTLCLGHMHVSGKPLSQLLPVNQQRRPDVTSMSGPPTSAVFPQRDDDGNLLETQYGRSVFRDQQHLTMQELPETAPPGQLPRSCDIILEDDLVDAAKPGDRIAVAGVFKAVPPKAAGTMSGNFRAVMVANHVRQLTIDASLGVHTDADMKAIKALAAEASCLDTLAASLAPSIFGHTDIKRALVLLLLGGRERNLANGSHLRGDINCLMVGDPGVAKSQLLRAVMNVAPLAVSTTGRGSSGVGLTAAITHDSDTGERRLEAGAMVLADRGLVCIDEFDKMNDNDRVAIHEVMEQQTVTIAKAGIHCSLNARCSVVAAANPLYGSYDHSLSVTRNINLPDSLLSRFDLLFICLDEMDAHKDRLVADHVIGQHQYRGTSDGRTLTDEQAHRREEEGVEGTDTQQYVKYNSKLHGTKGGREDRKILTTAFLKKFIKYAKTRYQNVELTAEAMEAIGDFYAELRGSSDIRALPVTVRTLETVIRLSSAAAKVRLSGQVETQDVETAKGLVSHVLKADKAPERRTSQPAKRGRDSGGDGSGSESGDDDAPAPQRRRGSAAARAASEDAGEAADAAPRRDTNMPDADAAADEPASGRHSRSGRRASGAGAAAAGSAATAGPSAGGDGAGLSAGRINAVAVLVREMFLEGSAVRFPLKEVVQRAANTRMRLSEAQLETAIKELHRQSEESESAPVALIYKNGYLYDSS